MLIILTCKCQYLCYANLLSKGVNAYIFFIVFPAGLKTKPLVGNPYYFLEILAAKENLWGT